MGIRAPNLALEQPLSTFSQSASRIINPAMPEFLKWHFNLLRGGDVTMTYVATGGDFKH